MTSALRAIVVALALVACACGGGPTAPSSVSAPSTGTPGTATNLAPPPVGVSAEVWRVAFNMEDKLLGTDKVPMDLSSFPESVKNFWRNVAAEATNFTGGRTTFSVVDGGSFKVSIATGPICGGAACTSVFADFSGKINGGTMQFTSTEWTTNKAVVLHEMFRAIGMLQSSPKPGLMSRSPTTDTPTDEEKAVILGRYNYPLLSIYTP